MMLKGSEMSYVYPIPRVGRSELSGKNAELTK